MTQGERDEQLLQEYLEGDSELSRLYRRGAEETPGAHLDARILGEARRAVRPGPRLVHSPFARHWLVPTSLAAVFVLSVSMVLMMPEPLDGPGMGVEESNGPAPARDGSLRDAAGERTGAGAAPAPPAAPASIESDTRPEPATGPEHNDAAGRAAGARPPPAASSGQRAAETTGKSAEKRKAEGAERSFDAAHEAPAAPEAGASPALQPPAAALRESAGEPARTEAVLPGPSVRNDPDAWIAFMEVLLDARDVAGAKQNLRAFRRRFPDYPLPASLRDLAASLDTQPP